MLELGTVNLQEVPPPSWDPTQLGPHPEPDGTPCLG